MSIFCVRNQQLSWQDRTMNVEVMMAPTRAQLLYNKHKGLNTRYRQEFSNLEREKTSYLRSFRTELRLMERRKDMYVKRRNDIQIRRQSADSRRRSISTDGGRKSAPPRLEREVSKGDNTFLTQLDPRDSKSAEPATSIDSFRNFNRPTTDRAKLTSANLETSVTPCWTTPTPVVGKPYLKLERQKSVRFSATNTTNKESEGTDKAPVELTLEDKIRNFMKAQSEFNKREIIPAAYMRSARLKQSSFSDTNQRNSGHQSTSMIKLENAFNDFCGNKSPESFSKLVKFASKIKNNFRNSGNLSIVPTIIPARGDKTDVAAIKV